MQRLCVFARAEPGDGAVGVRRLLVRHQLEFGICGRDLADDAARFAAAAGGAFGEQHRDVLAMGDGLDASAFHFRLLDACARCLVERRADGERHAVRRGQIDAARVQHAAAQMRECRAAGVTHARDHAGFRDDARVGAEDARDIGVDLALGGAKCCGECHGGSVGAAAAECRDVVLVVDALEAGQHDDVPGIERLAQPLRVDLLDAGLAVRAVCHDADLRPGEADGPLAEFLNRHRGEGDADLLAGREEHVHLAGRRRAGDLGRLRDEVVGGAALRGHDDDHLVAGVLRADGLACRLHHAVRVLHTRPAELLNHDGLGRTSRWRSWLREGVVTGARFGFQ